MSRKTQEALEPVLQETKSTRRTLMKRALMVLGAGVLLQPVGAVFGASLQEKKEDRTQPKESKNFDKKKKSPPHKKGRKKEETPKKEGG